MITKPLDQIRSRYGELIDKKYGQNLSKEEQKELNSLEKLLDEAESLIYEPLKQALIAKRDELRKNKTNEKKEK